MLAVNPMLPIDTVNNRINQYLPVENTVPIAIHFDNYNAFKPDAVDNNLLTVSGDDVVHDVPNRVTSPYLLKNLFTASPIKSVFENGNFALVFKQNLFFNNSGLTVSSLYIDFDDGQGYQTSGWNVETSPNYTEAGEKTIKIKIVLSNNSQYECYATITVKQITALERFNPDLPSTVQIFNANSNHSGGRAFVRYSTLNTTGHLQKPLIVLEGYDASATAPNLAGTNYTYKNFVLNLDGSLPAYDFNEQLDDVAGYDLVFIDYNNGTDDIVRNANLFKSVLAWVNTDKALGGSTQQNVVMGISMGGLVARYALADLTKTNIATQTRLLITHDSPHQGANVPVGLQRVVLAVGELTMFGKKITDVFPDYSETTAVLNAQATLQMLTYRVAYHDGPLILNSWLNATYKPMVTFQSTDPAPSYRFIATSQGSECGTPLFAPGTQLLNVQAGGGAITIIVPGLKGKLEVDIQAHALPALGSSGQIARVKILAKIYYLFIRLKKTGMDYSASVSGTILPIDGASGGTSPIGALDIAPQSISGGIGLIVANYRLSTSATSLNNFCFVPTASALDVQTYNNASLSATYVGGWSPLNPSSAETFIAQEGSGGTFNERHTRFTARNAEWLFDEMEGITNTLNCSSNCQTAFSISGPAQFCTTATYTIPNLPSTASLNWSISPTSGVANLSVSGNTATLTKVGDGSVVLIASVSNSCGSFNVTTTVTPLNSPSSSFTATPHTGIQRKELRFYINSTFDIQNSYQWQLDGYPVSNSAGYILEGPDCGSGQPYQTHYKVKLIVTSPCGLISESCRLYIFNCNSNSFSSGEFCDGIIFVERQTPQTSFAYYPNPANNNLTITQQSNINSKEEQILNVANNDNKNPYSIKIFDQYAKVLLNFTSKDGKDIQINTASIPNGTYFLHIFQGKEVIKKQIIIQH